MRRTTRSGVLVAVLVLGGSALATCAWAHETRSHGGGGESRGDIPGEAYVTRPDTISESDRIAILGYYAGQMTGGRCPAGLSRQGVGCHPPQGTVRTWAVGRPLPTGPEVQELPPVLASWLRPPPGYRFVRFGSDILLVANATGIVTAGIQDQVQ